VTIKGRAPTEYSMFKKILIANRGEIAVRIIRACRELGIKAVAVYSEIDRKGLHVRMADEAYFIGPSPSTASYLNMEKLIEVAKKAGCEGIHPGYGFLAENSAFARKVEEQGLVFIGPPASAIELLGDKMAARKTMKKAGIEVVPGTEEPLETEEQGLKIARKIGFPILIKAAGGGGGNGMRVVREEKDLKEAMRACASEAKSAFADARIYIEKYLEKPRHVEIQILGDKFGKVIHLGERECSIQRRHQKVIEESPSPIVDEKMRKKMGETAVKAAKAAGYYNAGTMEFLVDPDKNFYFLEANTRLQVEHPVTEMVTGIDIAKEQIRIASGSPLSYKQEDVAWKGAAIECRIYAEDPENNFLPSTGTVSYYEEPAGPGIRVDAGLYEGCEIPIYYDPIIGKLITWGANRDEAIQRMKRALSEYHISGVATTIPFHIQVLDNEKFKRGELSTHFIQEEFSQGLKVTLKEDDLKMVALFAALAEYQNRSRAQTFKSSKAQGEKQRENSWKMEGRRRGLRKYEI
jgi:acetyl-CoA carboxylase biotin carboxylase subunit